MQKIVLCMLVAVVLGLMIINVKARSQPRCGECEAEECIQRNCECGTVKDDCNCCDLCRVCARVSCSALAGDVCEVGYHCAYPRGTGLVESYDFDGVCLPLGEYPESK